MEGNKNMVFSMETFLTEGTYKITANPHNETINVSQVTVQPIELIDDKTGETIYLDKEQFNQGKFKKVNK